MKCKQEFSNRKVRWERAEKFLECELRGRTYESEEMEWTVEDLCGDEIEDLWKKNFAGCLLNEKKKP